LSSRPTGSKNFRSTWIGHTCPNKKAKLKLPLYAKNNIFLNSITPKEKEILQKI